MASRSQTVRVKGMREFLRATDRAGKETKKEVRAAFRKTGDVVKVEAARLFGDIDPRSAKGFRTSVKQKGVSVEQSLRRVTGTRPDYGALQMRHALLPAVEHKEHEIEDTFNDAMDHVADHFGRRP